MIDVCARCNDPSFCGQNARVDYSMHAEPGMTGGVQCSWNVLVRTVWQRGKSLQDNLHKTQRTTRTLYIDKVTQTSAPVHLRTRNPRRKLQVPLHLHARSCVAALFVKGDILVVAVENHLVAAFFSGECGECVDE